MTATPPRILAIAGSDSSGGAGIQADIKTIAMLGGYAMTAITAVTAQNTRGVQAVEVLPADLVAAPQADLARENERLRLENRVLKEERDILKKATQFFASQRPRGLRSWRAGDTFGRLRRCAG